MNSKERVYAALRREPVDRVPIFMWYHPQTKDRLSEILDIPAHMVSQALGDDITMTWINNNYAMEGIVHNNDGEYHIDEWGIEWTRIEGFNQITRYPLAEASYTELENYNFPENKIKSLIKPMIAVNEKKDNYFIGCDVSPCAFEMYWRLRGMENTMMDIITNPDFAKNFIRRCVDFAMQLSQAACRRFDLDWLWTGDDIGGQSGMILSPESWRNLIKPQLKRLVDLAKSKNIYAAFHSCGSIRPIIGDLLEIGVDVLNPIQCNCIGMDPVELKKEFGKDLAFMGGIDTQGLLPNGRAEEVYKTTVELIENMASAGGGYILAASHSVPPETPDENIFAMYAAAGVTKEEIFDTAAQIRTLGGLDTI
jgi:uroporphyrinogen decarboxylase